MEKIFFGLLLALIPIINFFFKYYFSKRNKELPLFKKHLTTYYFDWIFLPFNFFLVYTLNLELKNILIIIFLSIISFIFLLLYWIKTHKKERRPVYLFDIKSERIKPAGFIELLFFITQCTLIFSFIFSTLNNSFVYLQLIFLLFFLLTSIFSSIKIHGKLDKVDGLIALLGLILIIIKFIFNFK